MIFKTLMASAVLIAGAAIATPTATTAAQPSEFTRCYMAAVRGCQLEHPGDQAAIDACAMNEVEMECRGLDGDPQLPGEMCWITGGTMHCAPA